MTNISRSELRQLLIDGQLAGIVATPRENSLRKYAGVATRDPECLFGLEPIGRWGNEEVLAMMARRCGVSPDPQMRDGWDHIDVDLVLDGLDSMASYITEAATNKSTVLMASGHPAGLFAIYAVVSQFLSAAGCRLITPAMSWRGDIGFHGKQELAEIRYLSDVALLSERGHLLHCHSPAPMEAMIAELNHIGLRPDLVIADHGLAGAAGRAGLRTIGFADCNDPALFIGAEEGLVELCVPIDDNVLPHLYGPVTKYLLQAR